MDKEPQTGLRIKASLAVGLMVLCVASLQAARANTFQTASLESLHQQYLQATSDNERRKIRDTAKPIVMRQLPQVASAVKRQHAVTYQTTSRHCRRLYVSVLTAARQRYLFDHLFKRFYTHEDMRYRKEKHQLTRAIAAEAAALSRFGDQCRK